MSNSLTIEQVCSEVVDCVNRTAPETLDGEYFAVGTPAMRDNAINLSEARRLSAETFKIWTRRLVPEAGDLFFAREAPVGPVVRIPPGGKIAAGQRVMHLRANPAVVHERYLFYLLISPNTQARLMSVAMGSTVPHLRVADVKAFGLQPLPSIEEQRGIAEVLGALDDKIAANRSAGRIALELADTIFAATVQGIPMSDTTFDDLSVIGGGGTPKTTISEYWGDDVNWATPTDVTGLSLPYLETTARLISTEGLAACSSALYPKGSILMTSRATVGAFAIAEVDTAVNQGFIVVNAKDPRVQWWIFHEMRSRIDEFISHANGATFLELPRSKFKKFPVRMPDAEVVQRFSGGVGPLHAFAAQIGRESRILAKTRDELLPLLMSGNLRVKDVEKKVEEIV